MQCTHRHIACRWGFYKLSKRPKKSMPFAQHHADGRDDLRCHVEFRTTQLSALPPNREDDNDGGTGTTVNVLDLTEYQWDSVSYAKTVHEKN